MHFGTLSEWLAWQESLHPKPIDLGLERVNTVFQRMERHHIPRTLTVGGTNGKGSCVAMLDSILRAAGYKVGSYTSPHLLRYNERICIGGNPVSDAELMESFERVDSARDEITLSFFEFGTLAALDIFSRNKVDVQLLEVGLGGRLDAVNLVDADGALISSIDIDHEDWLGVSREQIAMEKAGIYRSGRPAVFGDARAMPSIAAYAESIGAHYHEMGTTLNYDVHSGQGGWRWTGLSDDGGTVTHEDLPPPALPGAHQYANAASVLQLLTAVDPVLPVTEAALHQGLKQVKLAGRFQTLSKVWNEPQVIIDVAHNPASASVLASQLLATAAGRPVEAIFSIMRDKDMNGVIHALKQHIQCWHLVPLSIPRAAPLQQMESIFQCDGGESAFISHDSLSAALQTARSRLGDDGLLLVFGSFILVSDFMALEQPTLSS